MTAKGISIMTYTITSEYDGHSVLDYLKKQLHLSRAAITALKKKEHGIMLGDVRVTVRAVLHTGNILDIDLLDGSDDRNEDIEPVNIPISVLFENDDLIIVNKPSGMPTHPSRGHQGDTLANALSYYFMKKNTPFVFRAVNRLDRDTSGCVLIAKNKNAAWQLSRLLMSGKIEKTYLAVVCGEISNSGTVEANIKRRAESIIERVVCDNNEGQYAKTIYSPIRVCGEPPVTLLSVTPVTGRTHQIRVHLSHIGHPICGDTLYGDNSGDSRIARQALHCSSLSFPLPSTDSIIKVTAPLFNDMSSLITSADIEDQPSYEVSNE